MDSGVFSFLMDMTLIFYGHGPLPVSPLGGNIPILHPFCIYLFLMGFLITLSLFFFFLEKQCIRQLRIVTKYLAILPNALERTSEARDRGKNALMHTHCGVVWDSSNLGGFPHLPPTH